MSEFQVTVILRCKLYNHTAKSENAARRALTFYGVNHSAVPCKYNGDNGYFISSNTPDEEQIVGMWAIREIKKGDN